VREKTVVTLPKCHAVWAKNRAFSVRLNTSHLSVIAPLWGSRRRGCWSNAAPTRTSRRSSRRFEDTETSIEQLKARIGKTLAFLKTVDASSIDGAGDREITFPLGPTNKGNMKGVDFLNHFVLPNFYFHLTAAYALLRHCGVDLGKRDFLGTIPLRLS
jgi:hypothetical protein